MSVLSPVIDYLDLATKHIYLLSGVREYHPVEDIYAEIRYLRKTTEAYRIFDIPVTAYGNIFKGGGKYTPRYARFNDGWTIVPEDVTHDLLVSGEQITDDGQSGKACMDLTALSVGVSVFIQYEPPAAEIVRDTESLAAIAFMSFGNPAKVTVDVINGDSIATFTGDQNLLGNAQHPVDNFDDAYTIATAKRIHALSVVNSANITTQDFSGFTIGGTNHVNVELIVDSPADVTNVRLDEVKIVGTLDGGTEVNDCILGSLVYYFNGHIHDSSLGGRIVLGGSTESYIANCTRLSDEVLPEVDFDNGNNHLVLANYTGVINFTNMTDPNANAMVGLNQGVIVLNSANCTAGTVTATGLGKVMDENGDCIPPGMWNGMLVMNSLISNESITQSVWSAATADHTIVGSTGEAVNTGGEATVNTEDIAEAVWTYTR